MKGEDWLSRQMDESHAAHAKHIVERFNHLYPHYHSHFCRQIDYSVNH